MIDYKKKFEEKSGLTDKGYIQQIDKQNYDSERIKFLEAELEKETKNWAEDRKEEVLLVESLLNDLTSINNGSGFMARMARCIEAAERLTELNIDKPRPRFIQFLYEQANKGRRET